MTCARVKAHTGPRRGFICLDDGPFTVPGPDCPNADQHTPQPSGYIAASSWADEMMKSHDQQRCAGCGRWLVWVSREAA